jgi:quercetin dioxygenase-like cupin family protein
MKRALMACAVLATLALPLTALADTTTKAAGTAAGTTAKAEMTTKAAAAEMTGHVQKLAGATWIDAPGYPAGVKMAGLHKDDTIACAYLKFPAGTKVAAHTHPAAHYATVISGTGTFGFGTDTKGSPMAAGDFVYVPAGAPHWITATTEVIVFGSMIGPEGTTYVNPADDPSKGQATTAH